MPLRKRPAFAVCLAACLWTLAAAVLHSNNEADWHFRTSVITPEESAELREEVREMVRLAELKGRRSDGSRLPHRWH